MYNIYTCYICVCIDIYTCVDLCLCVCDTHTHINKLNEPSQLYTSIVRDFKSKRAEFIRVWLVYILAITIVQVQLVY